MFSPEQEAQTPDTSDHSTDEFKVSFPKHKLNEPKPLSTAQLAEELPQLLKKDISLSQLLNQLSNNNNNNNVNNSNNHSNLIPPVVDFILNHKMDIDNLRYQAWKRKLAVYLCLYESRLKAVAIDALQSVDGLKESGETFTRVQTAVKTLTASNVWTQDEIEHFHTCIVHNATRTGMGHLIEQKSIAELNNAVTQLMSRFYWTKGEMTFLENHLGAGVAELCHEIPLRAKHGIVQMVWKVKKSRNQVALAKKAKPNPSTKKSVRDLEVTIAEKKVVNLTDSSMEDTTEDDNLAYCIQHDLSRETLEALFPDWSLSETLDRIVFQAGPLDSIALTTGEKQIIKDSIKKQKSLESVQFNFPCRSKDYLVEKFKEFEFVSSRKTKFKSLSERLLYEAKWVLYSSGETFTTTRRSRKRALEESFETMEKEALVSIYTKPAPKQEMTPEELEERERRREALKELRRLANERKALLRKQRKEDLERRKAAGLIKAKPKSDITHSIKDLLAGSEHFQSVIGDKKKVEEGQKRKRIQAVHYRPEIEPKKPSKLKVRHRQAEKSKIKLALKLKKQQEHNKRKPKKEPKKKKKTVEEESLATPETEEFIKEEIDEDEEEEEEEDTYSPFDPVDLNSDSFVPLHGRQFYAEEIYVDKPHVPELKFVEVTEESENLLISSSTLTETKRIMTTNDDDIVYEDCLAADIIRSHIKNYRDLPISFPPLLDPSSLERKIYPTNKVRIRFLLYPQHCELFILAAPKTNELDPVYEIIKLFMIHYALFFSHSSEIRRIITEEYCQKIEHSIEENDFSDFMFVVDKWNALMLKLSPNEEAVQSIVQSGKEDINAGLRSYLSEQEIRVPTSEDLKLQAFLEAVILEDLSPTFQLIKEEPSDAEKQEFVPKHLGDVEAPKNVSDELKDMKPDDYNLIFFTRLKEKTEISRFATQQILLRIYSRIVSTDSRKLRSYKAFTAEVYGELLPSFTSEVLEKVNLLPNQKFYDLGSGVGNTTFQAALEFGASMSGGCELMEHASKLTKLQEGLLQKHMAVLGLKKLNFNFALLQSFVDNDPVRDAALDCEVLIINNYLFDGNLNAEVGRLLCGLKPGTKIISLRNFISPRYRATGDTIFDFFKVEKHEMSDFLSVSWTANKVPYYISTVQDRILPEYLGKDESPDSDRSTPTLKSENGSSENLAGSLTPFTATPEPDMFKDLSCVLGDEDDILLH